MKIFELKFFMTLVLMIGLAPTTVLPDEINPHLKACLDTPDNNLASTAMACAFALQFSTAKEITVPDALQQRIAELKKNGELHEMLRNEILDTMRLNRRAFQSEKVIQRYGDGREALVGSVPVFEQCGLPRDGNGHPLPQYAHSFSNPDHGVAADYPESKGVLRCLETSSGLAGVRAEPLTQHYYCTLPGNSPEIRSCFTFQIRVSSNTRSNSHKNIFMKDDEASEPRVIENAKKEWIFAGTQQDFQDAKDSKSIPRHVITKAANYCSADGRAARITDLTMETPVTYWHTDFLDNYLKEAERHQDPANTNEDLLEDYIKAKSDAESSGTPLLTIDQIDLHRNENSDIKAPLCWINQTQRSVFQLMLSPAVTMYFDRDEQLSLIHDYYQCNDDTVMQEYRRSDRKMRNYCPDNFDGWN